MVLLVTTAHRAQREGRAAGDAHCPLPPTQPELPHCWQSSSEITQRVFLSRAGGCSLQPLLKDGGKGCAGLVLPFQLIHLEGDIPLALKVASLPPRTFPRPLVCEHHQPRLSHSLTSTYSYLHNLICTTLQITSGFGPRFSSPLTNWCAWLQMVWPLGFFTLRGLLWFVSVFKFSSVQQLRADNFSKVP